MLCAGVRAGVRLGRPCASSLRCFCSAHPTDRTHVFVTFHTSSNLVFCG